VSKKWDELKFEFFFMKNDSLTMITLVSNSGDKYIVDDGFSEHTKLIQQFINDTRTVELIQSSEDIELIVSFYLGKKQLTTSNIVQVFLLSEYFDITPLTHECFDFLQAVLNGKSTEEIRKIMRTENDLSTEDIKRISMENYFIEKEINKIEEIGIVENPITIPSINILKKLVKMRKLKIKTIAAISRLHSQLLIVRNTKIHMLLSDKDFKAFKKNDKWPNIKIHDIHKIVRTGQFKTKKCIKELGTISEWDTSSVTDMKAMFLCLMFNRDISKWDTSSVTNMKGMFCDSMFNQDISEWDTSSVTNMKGMFCDSIFNQDISEWDISNVTNIRNMFLDSKFNQDISGWDTSNVTNMESMFQESKFNRDISKWDTSKVISMKGMFYGSKFNQDISKWDISNVTNMSWMFYDSCFNQDISGWNTSNVTNMRSMFGNSKFNRDISEWNTSSVTTMEEMFCISKFNKNISEWDTSSVTNMRQMFYYSMFNHDISGWNTSSVTTMEEMFCSSQFNQNISG